ncbi:MULTISPECIES: hypothetical protein [unclassified Saccharicrinis]|uniref:hypothetical protein n=1 Tax=unclassified Saccharicrinis TaxID=2646859 RepID=UPI003D3292C6
MKSKQNFNKKSGKRSANNEFDDKIGLKPVKSKSGKISKKISIYDDLDDDFDENDLENLDYDKVDFDFDQDFEIEDEDDEY